MAAIDVCAETIDEVNAVSAASVLAAIDVCAETIDEVNAVVWVSNAAWIELKLIAFKAGVEVKFETKALDAINAW